jgi:hypothetical protein
MSDREGSITRGLLWMILLSILLFWLPVVGPFIAGLVGGKKAGGVGNAIIAVLIPALVFGFLLAALATMISGLPVIGFIAGLGGTIIALSHVIPLLLGAVIGGLLT